MMPSGRVLVVDDQAHLREILSHFLRYAGHEMVPCPDGLSALERLRTESFDLVITDLGLPDVPGLEIARMVKNTAPETPVVIMTGSGDQIDHITPDEAARLGVDYMLAKPFTRGQFLSLVASALARAA